MSEGKLDKIQSTVEKLFNISLYSYQLNLLNDCLNKKNVLGIFPRQAGKSTVVAVFCLLSAVEKENKIILILSPTQRQSDELLLKVSNLVNNNSILKKSVKKQTSNEIVFKNKSRVLSLPIGDDGRTIVGFSADVIIMEEASYIPDSIVNQVIMPMGVSKDCTVIKIGTPKGRNHFYQSYTDKGVWIVHHITWKDALACGQYKQAFIEARKKECDTLTFKTEYEAQFVEDADAFFGDELIEGSVDIHLTSPSLHIDEGCIHYLGVDVARLGKDQTVFEVMSINKETKELKIVYWDALKKATLDMVISRIRDLHSNFDFQQMYIDETGCGAGVTDVLSKEFNPRYINMKLIAGNYNLDKHTLRRLKVVGITFTNTSKFDIYSQLKLLFEQGKLKIPNVPELIQEIKDFRYEVSKYGNILLHHSPNGFDDWVDALALVCQGVRHEPVMNYPLMINGSYGIKERVVKNPWEETIEEKMERIRELNKRYFGR